MPSKSKMNYFLLFLFSCFIGLAQPVQLSSKQGTVNSKSINDLTQLSTNYSKWRNDLLQTQNLVNVLKHDTCLNKKFSIVFYIIEDSSKTFTNPLTYPTNLNNFIANSLAYLWSCQTICIKTVKF